MSSLLFYQKIFLFRLALVDNTYYIIVNKNKLVLKMQDVGIPGFYIIQYWSNTFQIRGPCA